MVRVQEAPDGASVWNALTIEGTGRAFDREQVEAIIAQRPPAEVRVLLPLNDQTAQFAPDSGPAPTWALLPGETIWSYGAELSKVDLILLIRSALADGPGERPSPEPDQFPIPVSSVVNQAMVRYGTTNPHDVEAVFDRLIMEVGGQRHDDPPYYGVPLKLLA